MKEIIQIKKTTEIENILKIIEIYKKKNIGNSFEYELTDINGNYIQGVSKVDSDIILYKYLGISDKEIKIELI